MRLVFFGTAAFAVPSLRACAANHDVLVVVTQPDRPGARGRPASRPVAEAARALSLEVWQPERVREPSVQARITALGGDALVVAAFGQIIPERLLDAHRHGGVNVHASLLPRWRGAAPVAAAILAGDPETGVSIMRMDRGLDTGPVFLQRRVTIAPDATTPAVTAELAGIGAEALLEVLTRLMDGAITAVPQDEASATHAPRLTRADAVTDWAACDALDVDRRVRALQPWPGVLATLDGVAVQIVAGGPDAGRGAVAPGQIVRSEGESLVVAARSGAYRIDLVTPPGRRTMSPAAFLRGRRTGSARR
jgi:methionyl-tRNA formyltransferase